MGSGGTGCNHNPVQLFLLDQFFDLFLTVLRTGIKQILGVGNIGQLTPFFCHLFYIDGLGNINSAVADE